MNKLKRVVKYGVEVWCNERTDILRGSQCLCLNCALMNNGCLIAKNLYDFCRNEDIALMVTRCPNWKEKPPFSLGCGGDS